MYGVSKNLKQRFSIMLNIIFFILFTFPKNFEQEWSYSVCIKEGTPPSHPATSVSYAVVIVYKDHYPVNGWYDERMNSLHPTQRSVNTKAPDITEISHGNSVWEKERRNLTESLN